jgi:3-oxoacyl-[acyl-carrier-protein] synthase II
MVPREAAGCLVLEHCQRAQARGAGVLAELHNSVSGCEAHHLVAPLPGQALSHQLLQRLRREDNRAQTPIDWLCLHATGTPRFDREEVAFVNEAFATLPWISALKRSLGHGLGAAGVVEAALIVEGLRCGEVPPWPAEIDPALGLPRQPAGGPPIPERALQLASGMGGVVVMNLFSRGESQPSSTDPGRVKGRDLG